MRGRDEGRPEDGAARHPVAVVFAAFLRLGLTSFGGPVAHLGYFREEFVVRRRWLGEDAYADLVALCQFLPGPASSQVGIGIGLVRAGIAGAAAAWAAFTLPSALALTAFGYGVVALGEGLAQGWLQGLKIAAVAVVAQAVWGMARALCPDAPRASVAVLAAIAVLAWPTPAGQAGVIVAGGLAGLVVAAPASGGERSALGVRVSPLTGAIALALFFALLGLLPVLAASIPGRGIALVDGFYRSGSLVFGGGHVVLPLLQAEVVPPGWVDADRFLAGYGAAQAVPGPLFTFAAYLGTVMREPPSGWAGAAICLGAVFAPSFLLVIGTLPFWERLRGVKRMRRALAGVNAAVVGLLLAALYDPVWTGTIGGPRDFGLALAVFALLVFWKVPPWLVVALAAAGGAAIEVLAHG